MRNTTMFTMTALAALLATPAAMAAQNERIDLTTYDKAKLHEGWRATELLGKPVRGAEGEEIGDVRNILLDLDGQVTRIFVESGGILDIGDVHLSVPWENVTVAEDKSHVTIPRIDENIPDFSLFAEDPEKQLLEWRAYDLIHDYVELDDNDRFGIVQDLIFTDQGQLEAVIVSPDIGRAPGAPYAVPHQRTPGAAPIDPGARTYAVPYRLDEIEVFGPFDRSALEG